MKGTAVAFMLMGLAWLIGIAFAFRAEQARLVEARASVGWPTVEGMVVEIFPLGSRNQSIRVRYQYRIDDRQYESERVSVLREEIRNPQRRYWTATKDRAYQEGQRVSVAYDPTRPERAVLEPEAPTSGYIASKCVGGGVITLLGLGLVTIGIRGLKS